VEIPKTILQNPIRDDGNAIGNLSKLLARLVGLGFGGRNDGVVTGTRVWMGSIRKQSAAE
jgi:hypothetical protein